MTKEPVKETIHAKGFNIGIYTMPEPRILPSSIGGEMNWRFPVFSVADLVELR